MRNAWPVGPIDTDPGSPGQVCPSWIPGRCTILLVENEELIRRRLHNFFEEKGFNLLEAEDREEALLIAEYHEGCIDVLITDSSDLSSGMRAIRPRIRALLVSRPFTAGDLLDTVQEVVEPQAMVEAQGVGR